VTTAAGFCCQPRRDGVGKVTAGGWGQPLAVLGRCTRLGRFAPARFMDGVIRKIDDDNEKILVGSF
jgi:hypothetical protein